MQNLDTSNPIRIFFASAASPFQQSIVYDGQRTPEQLALKLKQLRSVEGGWAMALIFTHKHASGVEMARDCETNEICKWSGNI